jgi:hypothetical protein
MAGIAIADSVAINAMTATMSIIVKPLDVRSSCLTDRGISNGTASFLSQFLDRQQALASWLVRLKSVDMTGSR